MADDPGELARSRFVEQFAMLMNDAGLPRMPARVFAYVLASDAETHTAAELAEGLRVSPAAISGAVRVLTDVGLVVRDRVPGDRIDHYRLHGDDVWASTLERQEPMFRHVDAVFTDALRLFPLDRPGGRRIHETREFYRFIESQLGPSVQRWRERRAELSAVRTEPEPARAASGE